MRGVVRAGWPALMVCAAVALCPAPALAAAPGQVDAFPVPGARVASPATQITFRGVPASQLGTVTVQGSVSGAHTGTVEADSDGRGASFVPSSPFTPGETVTVG